MSLKSPAWPDPRFRAGSGSMGGGQIVTSVRARSRGSRELGRPSGDQMRANTPESHMGRLAPPIRASCIAL
eukprot:scaffold115818_cov52-Phaeocystis_antarctica.AAC.2